MYISRILLNPRSRLVRNDVGDRYHLHRTVMSGFPGQLPPSERVLYRLETVRTGDITLLVQSQIAPDWTRSDRLNMDGVLLDTGEENPWVKVWNPAFRAGQTLQFRLTANPTVKRDGKRHALLKEEDQAAWLARKAAKNGFGVLALQIGQEEDSFGRKESHALKWHGVRFDGVLEVADAALFAGAVASGVGAAKGFGFGLLSVLPTTR